MTEKKLTLGGLLGSFTKRTIKSIQLTEDAPEEAHQLLRTVQNALKDEDEEPTQKSRVDVIDVKDVEP